jgi:decaprenylphospho-beta-D-ribofuranose 2-oxidase
MSLPPVPPERIARLAGFGLAASSDAYLYQPGSLEEVREVFRLAESTGRQVVLRGAGRSYGDASTGAECLALDLRRMRCIRSWDPVAGVIECDAGTTLEEVWRHCLPDGWWLPVVSGTMYPTLAGALAMNIHGKNNFRAGPLGEHVLELEVLWPDGGCEVLHPTDPRFRAVVGGLGLLGVITRVKLQMKRVRSGDLRVLPIAASDWDEQFALFEEHGASADYMVSWIDAFGRGRQAGRGLFHAAWHTEEAGERPPSLLPDHQDLPDTLVGFLPKSVVWRFLKAANHRLGMRFLNAAKGMAGRLLGNGRPHSQSLVAFSFLLDYVPHWRNAYLPHGFIQHQSFVPAEHARRVFALQVAMQQEERLESYLCVLKRHRRDGFLLSHAVDGYSLALDFKVTPRNRARLWRLCHRMNDLVLEAGGRFYFAKDSTLRPEDARQFLGGSLDEFLSLKAEVDPHDLLTSDLARRVLQRSP